MSKKEVRSGDYIAKGNQMQHQGCIIIITIDKKKRTITQRRTSFLEFTATLKLTLMEDDPIERQFQLKMITMEDNLNERSRQLKMTKKEDDVNRR